ncbi:DUF7716 domain-containing protein [Bacillus chungangensis]
MVSSSLEAFLYYYDHDAFIELHNY